ERPDPGKRDLRQLEKTNQMPGRRCVENDCVIALLVEKVADGAECCDLVDARWSQFNQFSHRLAIEFDLHARAARQRREQLIGPGSITLLQLFKPLSRIDLHRVEVFVTSDPALQLADFFIKTI